MFDIITAKCNTASMPIICTPCTQKNNLRYIKKEISHTQKNVLPCSTTAAASSTKYESFERNIVVVYMGGLLTSSK